MRNIIITRSFIFLNRKIKRLLLLLVTIFLCARMMGETIIPDSISNPIRTGFHPDPSICRVGEDYYLGEFYQFNLSSCIRQQNSLTAQFV
ncbi:hypothetical protein AAH051_21815, partial [Phocaeicola dorei]